MVFSSPLDSAMRYRADNIQVGKDLKDNSTDCVPPGRVPLLVRSEVSQCPLNLSLGVDQEVGAGNDSLSYLQTAGDLIVSFLIGVCEINKQSANLNEPRLQPAGSQVDKH